MVARFGSIAKLYKQLYDWTIDLWQWSSLLPCQELSAPSWVLVQPQWGLCNRLRAVVAGFSWPVLSTNVNLWHDLSCQVPTNQGRSRVDLPLEDCRSYIPEIRVLQRFDSLLTVTRQMLAEHLGRQFVLDWQPLPGCNCCWTGWKSPLKELTEKGINFTALPPLWPDLTWRFVYIPSFLSLKCLNTQFKRHFLAFLRSGSIQTNHTLQPKHVMFVFYMRWHSSWQ